MSFSYWAISDICERAMEGCLCMVKVLDVRTGLPHQNPTTSRKSSDFDAVALAGGVGACSFQKILLLLP